GGRGGAGAALLYAEHGEAYGGAAGPTRLGRPRLSSGRAWGYAARMIRACLLVVAAGALAAMLPVQATAQAEINRCTAPDGTSIYTDRECSALGAVDRLPQDRSAGGSGGNRSRGNLRRNPYQGGCARSIHQLIQRMTVAIDAGDANELA